MWRSAEYDEKLRERVLWACTLELALRPMNLVVALLFSIAMYRLGFSASGGDPVLPVFGVALFWAASFLGYYFYGHRAATSLPVGSYVGFAATGDGRLHVSSVRGNSVVKPADLRAFRRRGSCWIAVHRNRAVNVIPRELLPAEDVTHITAALSSR